MLLNRHDARHSIFVYRLLAFTFSPFSHQLISYIHIRMLHLDIDVYIQYNIYVCFNLYFTNKTFHYSCADEIGHHNPIYSKYIDFY